MAGLQISRQTAANRTDIATQSAKGCIGTKNGVLLRDVPDFHQVFDGLAKSVVKVVLPHDAGHAWVGQDVSIACLLRLACGEGPMLLSAACTQTQHFQIRDGTGS